ncbi:potassium channel family protein [Ralstonia pseudosolanacearum]|uniref:potassium channel family protein n=1 Tax=Ralstonia pseudosolanacearum TaxID=1310165 RepID=UPI003CF776E0
MNLSEEAREELIMNNVYPSPSQLWGMPPHVFNEWRAKNDLPRLFEFLKDLLPGFVDWFDTLPFGMDVALRVVPTGDLFKGKRSKVVFKRDGDLPGTHVIECREGTSDEAREWWGIRHREITILGEVEPYFKWAKRALGRKRFFIWNVANRQISEDFVYGSWRTDQNGVSTASLFQRFDVLKLGQVQLPHLVQIGSRNLDFCDLDGLQIMQGFHGSYWAYINYSSCRDVAFIGAEMAFVTFHNCPMDKLICQKSKLQDIYFDKTDVNELRLSDSFIFRMEFTDSNVTPFIQNTELREVKFHPKKGAAPSAIATTYRLLRAAYQSNGLRQEASECYYKERVFERKSYFHPYLIDNKKFQGVLHGGRFSVLMDLYNRGFHEKSDLPREIWKVLASKVKMHLLPRYFIPLMRSRFKWLASSIECLLWGYGERPSRILLIALTLIISYAGLYNLVEWLDDKGNAIQIDLWDSIYFSVVTFTTLGYGDIAPKTHLLKFLAGSEALCGAFTIGLIVAGFSNRSRY